MDTLTRRRHPGIHGFADYGFAAEAMRLAVTDGGGFGGGREPGWGPDEGPDRAAAAPRDVYDGIGEFAGTLLGGLALLVGYGYAVATLGPALGLTLGLVGALFAAALAYVAARCAWPVVVVALVASLATGLPTIMALPPS